ncbi:hypothetical protein [Polynucleobacter asymbioticus]|jgi:hypothetical protein|uniref:Uncharacterized protein n=1 Tax=Polynucleobacter asymbioticus TaxID=576611 RepID=A0AAC9IXW8_9BURK|nr:hypothetical protein [Polynucleobacter asymbioticus]APB98824.1 hypothetical protein A4F89_05525 [Polynucleobacter asymbioticus]APC01127.1 hypothetical protein AOC25_05620 [Polynucleobacter asymbioticus]
MKPIVNITRECSLGHPPTHSGDQRFYVQAIEPIKLNFTQINSGDYLLIDPLAKPVRGSYVLVGDAVAPWAGQENIKGRVVKVWRNEVEAGHDD